MYKYNRHIEREICTRNESVRIDWSLRINKQVLQKFLWSTVKLLYTVLVTDVLGVSGVLGVFGDFASPARAWIFVGAATRRRHPACAYVCSKSINASLFVI